jgi:hypothetical protein
MATGRCQAQRLRSLGDEPPRGMRLWHQRDSRDARNTVIAAGMIAFRLGGFAWTPAHENLQRNFLQRRESLSTVFSAALMRHRMSPATPHRDIHQTPMNTTQRLRAAPSLQARFAFPALTSLAQGFPDRLTDISATDIVHGRHCVFWLACASLLIPNTAKRESSLRFRSPNVAGGAVAHFSFGRMARHASSFFYDLVCPLGAVSCTSVTTLPGL